MNTYIPRGNFEDFVYRRLNEVINFGRDRDDAYVVFDFDNTSAIMDVEDNLMMYMLQHLKYKLAPEKFRGILTSGGFDLDVLVDGRGREVGGDPESATGSDYKVASGSAFTVQDLVEDIVKGYEWLYDHYLSLPEKNEALLESVRSTEVYQDFQAKLRFYYLYVQKHWLREPGKPWVTYWFAGYTVTEFRDLCREMLAFMSDQPFERMEFRSTDSGLTGVVEADFMSGLAFPEELVDLFLAFDLQGIDTYIISASPVDLVAVASAEYGYSVPSNRIIAMEYDVDGNDLIRAQMSSHGYITKGSGKSAAIHEQLVAQYGVEPLAIFGDSMGDYNMMTEFKNVQLHVLFNRLLKDGTQDIVAWAEDQYGQSDARYVVQGRNENLGILHPMRETIAFGQNEPRLYAE